MKINNAQYLKEIIHNNKNLFNDKIISDIACGSAWLSKEILKVSNPNYINAIDIRDEWIKKRGNHLLSKIFFYKEDIYNYKNLYKIIEDSNVLIYFGHFYHSANHEEIINIFSKTNAKDLFLESKVMNFELAEKQTPEIGWNFESTETYLNSYSKYQKKLYVGEPNLSYTKNLLKKYGWKINWYEQAYWQNLNFKKKIQYVIHATRV